MSKIYEVPPQILEADKSFSLSLPKSDAEQTLPEGVVQKTKIFMKDYFSDPALTFTVVGDPLIFMTPELLDPEHLDPRLHMEHSEVMFWTIGGQGAACIITRGVASYLHVNHPDYEKTEFWDKMPLRISGYTHSLMGLGLGAASLFGGVNAWREAVIASSLGIGDLILTNDIKKPAEIESFSKALMSSPNTYFSFAQGAILLPPMQAVADAVSQNGQVLESVINAAPVVPLAVAVGYIAKNALDDARINKQLNNSIVFNNKASPVMQVGLTAGLGGLAGFFSLSAQGKLVPALNDLVSSLQSMFTEASHQVANSGDSYVAAVSIATLSIAFAYAGLEKKFGTYFRPRVNGKMPNVTVVPKTGGAPEFLRVER